MNSKKTMFRSIRFFTLLGVVCAFATAPSVRAAPILDSESPAPIAAADDDCKQSVIALDLDVTTGDVYLVDSAGGLTLTDNDIPAYFGSSTTMLVDLQFSSGEWDVVISPVNGPVQTRRTRGGALRYWINDQPSAYTFSSIQVSGASTMMNMTPVVPDIVIRPKKDCPPSP